MIFQITAIFAGALLCFLLQFSLGLLWGSIWFSLIIFLATLMRWYWRLASKCYFTEWNYISSFNVWNQKRNNAYIAHRKTLDVFHARLPFAVLTLVELDQIAKNFSEFSDPRIAAIAMRLADEKRDASSLVRLGRSDGEQGGQGKP
jgi:hypothetical protein